MRSEWCLCKWQICTAVNVRCGLLRRRSWANESDWGIRAYSRVELVARRGHSGWCALFRISLICLKFDRKADISPEHLMLLTYYLTPNSRKLSDFAKLLAIHTYLITILNPDFLLDGQTQWLHRKAISSANSTATTAPARRTAQPRPQRIGVMTRL